jgi:hypothetical protein
MSTTAEIVGDAVRLKFWAPWGLKSHELFIRTKQLPEAKYEFDREADSYTVTAPARFAHLVGLENPSINVAGEPLASFLFPVQAWIVEMALKAKRFAVWADCGFGKTPMGLEWARQVQLKTGGRVLIICPKQLIHQWQEETVKFYGDRMSIVAIESREDFIAWLKVGTGFALASHHLFVAGVIDEVRYCAGVVLDESSILKGGGGVIKWNLIKSCRGIEYKLSCTATPAPNDTMEYASQASWLEKLRNEGEILWTYFMRDQKTQTWKVRPHAREAFYRFMSSWSIYIRKGSAYGFEDKFDLPEPEIVEHKLAMSRAQAAEHRKLTAEMGGDLLGKEKLGVSARSKLSQVAKGFIYDDEHKAKRIISAKPSLVARIVGEAMSEGRQVLVWTVFDEESDIILEHIADDSVIGLHGKDKEVEREEKIERFRHGEIRALVSKARLLGYGMNFQFCTRMVFSGFDDSFESFYQAVRRAHRYGATERLTVHVPYIPELEAHMWNNLLRKKNQWEADITEQERNYVQAMKEVENA